MTQTVKQWILGFFLILVGHGLVNGQDKALVASDQSSPNLTFLNPHLDFGVISQAYPITVHYYYRNDTDLPLSIRNVKCSCGCMAPQYERESIQPGTTGLIRVRFSPKGKFGACHKSTTVILDNGVISVLRLTGQILPDSSYRAAPVQAFMEDKSIEIVDLQPDSAYTFTIPFFNPSTNTLPIYLESPPKQGKNLKIDLMVLEAGVEAVPNGLSYSLRQALILPQENGMILLRVRSTSTTPSQFTFNFRLVSPFEETDATLTISGNRDDQ